METFLINCGLEGAIGIFLEHGIDLSQIFELNDYGDFLKELLPTVGDRMKLIKAIKAKLHRDENLLQKRKQTMDIQATSPSGQLSKNDMTKNENQDAVINILKTDKTMSKKLSDMAYKIFESFNSKIFEICREIPGWKLIDFTNGMVLCAFCGTQFTPHIRKDRPALAWNLGNVNRHLINFHSSEKGGNATDGEKVEVNSMLEVIINEETDVVERAATQIPVVRLVRIRESCDEQTAGLSADANISSTPIEYENKIIAAVEAASSTRQTFDDMFLNMNAMEIGYVNSSYSKRDDTLRLDTEVIRTLAASEGNKLSSVEQDKSDVMEIDGGEIEQMEGQQLNALHKDSSDDDHILHVDEQGVPDTNFLINDTPRSVTEQSFTRQEVSAIEQQKPIAMDENECTLDEVDEIVPKQRTIIDGLTDSVKTASKAETKLFDDSAKAIDTTKEKGEVLVGAEITSSHEKFDVDLDKETNNHDFTTTLSKSVIEQNNQLTDIRTEELLNMQTSLDKSEAKEIQYLLNDLINIGNQSITPLKLDENDLDDMCKMLLKSPGAEDRLQPSSTATLSAEAIGKDLLSFKLISSHSVIGLNRRLSVPSFPTLHEGAEQSEPISVVLQDHDELVEACPKVRNSTEKVENENAEDKVEPVVAPTTIDSKQIETELIVQMGVFDSKETIKSLPPKITQVLEDELTQGSSIKVSRGSRSVKRSAKYVEFLSGVREKSARATSKRKRQVTSTTSPGTTRQRCGKNYFVFR